jgi:hypothetical protein
MSDQSLYDQDFVAWTKEQADALRAAAKAGGRSNAVDWALVAEEVEDLGKSEWRTAYSLTARILEHLFLLSATRREEPKGHWRKEIRAFRRDLKNTLTPSIRLRLEGGLEALHDDSAQAVSDELATSEPEAQAFDKGRRWTLAQVLGETDDPLAAE